MSRFSGPQNHGASRRLHDQRRAEAETRQAEERTRDEARRAAYVEPPPLTDDELAELLGVVLTIEMGRRAFVDVVLRGRDPFKSPTKVRT